MFSGNFTSFAKRLYQGADYIIFLSGAYSNVNYQLPIL